MKSRIVPTIALAGLGFACFLPAAQAQSSRPRRVSKTTDTKSSSNSNSNGSDSLLDVVPANGKATTNTNANRRTAARDTTSSEPLLTPIPSNGSSRSRETASDNSGSSGSTESARSTGSTGAATPQSTPTRNAATNSAASGDTTHAFELLKQKQYDAAAKEAGDIAKNDPTNSEAWKILGFAKYNLKKDGEASDALQRALDLQRAAKQEDPNTLELLARSYARAENWDKALPLLVSATSRAGATPDAELLFLKGVASYQLKKPSDAEKAFNDAVKANPKDAASLFFLGRIAIEKNDFNAAISALNRATTAEPKSAAAWKLLTQSYMQRASLEEDDQAKADADYAGAVRAAEGLTKVKNDNESTMLLAQALIQSKQYARAATVLDRYLTQPDATGQTLYLLGLSHSRAKNFPKAIAALEKAASKTPNDAAIYRELGYDYESSKNYPKALSTYQRGAAIAPDDAFFKDSIARIEPYAKTP